MKFWFLVVLGVLIAIPIVQNTEVVTVKFYFWEATLSRVLLFLMTLVAGMVIGFAAGKFPRKAKTEEP